MLGGVRSLCIQHALPRISLVLHRIRIFNHPNSSFWFLYFGIKYWDILPKTNCKKTTSHFHILYSKISIFLTTVLLKVKLICLTIKITDYFRMIRKKHIVSTRSAAPPYRLTCAIGKMQIINFPIGNQ